MTRAARRLTAEDVGAWLFSCRPDEFRELQRAGAAVDWRCAHPTYRVGLVTAGQPAVLWVTGGSPARAGAPEPGIWLAGRTTGVVDRSEPRPRIGLALRPLAEPVPREQLRADRRTAGMEVLRAPQTSNPSVVTPVEWAVIARLLPD